MYPSQFHLLYRGLVVIKYPPIVLYWLFWCKLLFIALIRRHSLILKTCSLLNVLCVGLTLSRTQMHKVAPTISKIRLLKAFVWLVAMYGCESWTIRKPDEAKINAFVMKCLRQVLRVSWTAKKTNEWVLNTAGVERILLASDEERKLVYFGHVMRKKGDSLEKGIMQGTTAGSRSRGRPKTAWMSDITSWTVHAHEDG